MFFRNGKKGKLIDYLEVEKSSYPEIFESSPDIFLFVIDLKGVIVKIRGVSKVFTGIESNQIVGEKFNRFIYKDDIKKVEDYFKKVFGGESHYVKYRTIGFNGEVIHNDITLVPIRIDKNEVVGLYGLARNISKKVELINEIDDMQEQIESLVNYSQSLLYYSHEIITVLDIDGTIKYQSPSIETSLGYEPEEITGINCFDLIHPDDYKLAKSKLKEVIGRPKIPLTLEIQLKHKNGDWRNYEVVGTNLLDDSSVKGIVCNLHDITSLKKNQLEIQYMANHDYLTELPNRRAFEEKLDLEIRLANFDERKFAVLFLNLDGFKFLNDSLGYHVGDHLLIEIARKLNSRLSKQIEMLARIGGDEFAILTTKIQDVSSVENIAREVLKVFEQPFDVKGYNLFITSNVGASIYPESDDDASSLMKNAKLALYLAEKEGSNNYQIYSPTANIGTYKVFSLRNDLNLAIQEEQFLLYYQPILHTGTKQIVSVEALLRWDHPEWGIISPNEFIPLAEESGLIMPLGEWVIQTACRNLRLWHEAGYFIKVSINLSFVQFLQANLVDVIETALRDNELDPKWITIEVTESAIIEQETKVLEKVNRMRKMGIEISLDDFGTGYASFKKIKDLKPNVLKLDRSLIKEIPSNEESNEITKSIIQLANRLSIKVIAEGVETEEQHEFLKELQCNGVQGFLFSRPVSEENIVKLLKGNWDSEEEPQEKKERRRYFRVDFYYPLEASMTVAELNSKKVELGNTKVLVENIGPGGLRFLSNIKLPTKSDIILKFRAKIMNEEMTLYGTIVHDSEEGNLQRYGVEFIVDEDDRDYLIKEFNQLQLQLKRNPLLEDHSFVTGNVQTYFSK